MRVFVTGGNGFIGSVVVRKLLDGGHEVRCLLRKSSRTERIDDLQVGRAWGDVRDREAVSSAASGCDAIIHLAGLSAWTDIHSPSMADVVVGGTRNVLDAARGGRTRTVLVSSSIAVNGTVEPVVHNEDSPITLALDKYVYARAKHDAEALGKRAHQDGIPVVIVNPCEVYGPNDTGLITSGTLVDFARSNPVLVSKGGTSVVHVDDVAGGIVAALERGRSGERYILGGDNLSIQELARLTLGILGLQRRVVVLPNALLLALAGAGERFRLPLPFNPAVIPYAVHYWFMDNSKARSELGVSFRPARDTLEPTLEWLRAVGHIHR